MSLVKVTPVLTSRSYILFGFVPAKMEVGVMFLAILLAEIEPAYKYSGAQSSGLFSRHANPFSNTICAVLVFENSMVHIVFQGSRVHWRAARLIPDGRECIHFAQLHTEWDTAMVFRSSTSFLQCGRTPA